MTSQPTWCTVVEVTSITRAEPTDAQLAEAQFAMDALCGRSIDVYSSLRARDLHYLKLAMAYQCAWMMAQPDMYARTETSQVTSDGTTTTLPDGALVLAPMARRALRRVSWRQSRSISVASPLEQNTDGADEGWTTMPGFER